MIETIGYDKDHQDRQKNDYYATPPEEVSNILRYENLEGCNILEPACGEGHISKVLEKSLINKNIISTDLVDRGYGIPGLDFLSEDYPKTNNIDVIITNPPFKLIEEFVLRSLEIAKEKVIILARNQFVESQSRYNNIFKENPPSRIYQYVDRISCAKNGNFDDTQNSMAFAWFVWDKNYDGKTIFKWIRRWDKY